MSNYNSMNLASSGARFYNTNMMPFDALYGPWSSWEEFFYRFYGFDKDNEESYEMFYDVNEGITDYDSLIANTKRNIKKGLTIAIIEDGKVVEYWKPSDDSDFVKKQCDIEPGTTIDVADDNHLSFDDDKLKVKTQSISDYAKYIEEEEGAPTEDEVNEKGLCEVKDVYEFVKKLVEANATVIVDLPTAAQKTYTYNANSQEFEFDSTWKDKFGKYCTITNNTRTNAGTQKVSVALNLDNGMKFWKDGSSTSKEFTFTINPLNASNATITLDKNEITFGDANPVATATLDGFNLTYTQQINSTNAGKTNITVTFNGNFAGTATSENITINKSNANTVSVSISGSTSYSDKLTATASRLKNEGAISYAWYRTESDSAENGTSIGTNSNTYTLTTDDVGKKIYVVATVAATTNYNSNSKTSGLTSVITTKTAAFTIATNASYTYPINIPLSVNNGANETGKVTYSLEDNGGIARIEGTTIKLSGLTETSKTITVRATIEPDSNKYSYSETTVTKSITINAPAQKIMWGLHNSKQKVTTYFENGTYPKGTDEAYPAIEYTGGELKKLVVSASNYGKSNSSIPNIFAWYLLIPKNNGMTIGKISALENGQAAYDGNGMLIEGYNVKDEFGREYDLYGNINSQGKFVDTWYMDFTTSDC